ncbi:MAG TPA: hypothetical protein VFZ17_03370 [Acidimicrobiia bacterium]|nr:hypothetical protein [Acidimicrobiia bacterium]
MPWCAECDRFLSPSTVRTDGTCPTCGLLIEPGRAHAAHAADRSAAEADDELRPIPWHLWLLLAALAVYLGYRAFQGLEWVFGI